MTQLTTTLFRKVKIGQKPYVIGLHPNPAGVEPLLSIKPLGTRTPYVCPLSRVRIEAALCYGRAETTARREARRNQIPWKLARKKFLATLLPPPVKKTISKKV